MAYNILIVSSYVPYDQVGHAGGKTHNYYLKKFAADKDFAVKLITFGSESEKNKIDLEEYGIDHFIDFPARFFKDKSSYSMFELKRKYNIFDKSAGMLPWFKKKVVLEKLRQLKENGYQPDLILLEWTEIVLLIKDIKEIYPSAKCIASEHDVSFLSFKRRYLREKNPVKKLIGYILYRNILSYELDSLNQFDLIETHNFKDRDLLINHNIVPEKIDYITPFYMNMSHIKSGCGSKNILFFGAMNRPENFESCIWFIENVMRRLLEKDNTYKFIIIGSRPAECMKSYADENIVITGFVEDLSGYFENALCMVAPLVLGAGIKVKVLEGMSAGAAVLTNDIGIEGIPAVNGKEYLHCSAPEDYVSKITAIAERSIDTAQIAKNARIMLEREFDLEKSYYRYKENINRLMDKEQ